MFFEQFQHITSSMYIDSQARIAMCRPGNKCIGTVDGILKNEEYRNLSNMQKPLNTHMQK